MTDPFSLSVGIITLFKETYLVASYIYNTINSAKHSEEERKDVASKMRWEVLVLQSFGRYFSRNNGVVIKDAVLDQLWLSEILDTLERLRIDFADYTRLAGREDADYRAYSPWYNHEKESTTSIEFNIDNAVPFVTDSSFLTKLPQIWHEGKTKMRQAGVASRWALWDGRKLEGVVEKFKKRNAKLMDVLQIATATQQQGTSDALGMLLDNEDAKILGLTAHAEIRQLISKPEVNAMDFSLKNVVLVSDAETATIHTGRCEISAGKGNTVAESILIEYKNYRPMLGGLELSETMKSQSIIKSRIHQLAALLYSSGTNKLGTLPFKGLVDQTDKSRDAFVFYFPSDTDISVPESLHAVMETPSSTNLWPLAVRFKIAQIIAQTIGAFHADGWVHKSVRSESIVFFRHRGDKKLIIDSPYLVDFEYSRPESGSTLLLRDNNDEKNLYRHPEIQDVARSSFSKTHDIYSLGVVLLEIAMWQTARNMLKRTGLEPGAINAIGLQKMYIDRTKKRVAHLMGASYQSAVLACLESKYKDQTGRHDFPMIFREEVTQKLSAKGII